MSINYGDGYGKHTNYAYSRKSMTETGRVNRRQSGLWLTDIITETVNLTISKTIVDNIWTKIKSRLFKDDHADKNYRT